MALGSRLQILQGQRKGPVHESPDAESPLPHVDVRDTVVFDAEEVRLGRDPGLELIPLDHGPVRIHRLGIQEGHHGLSALHRG